jgi:hypothetical protein
MIINGSRTRKTWSYGQILPRMLFAPPGTPVSIPPGLSARLADIVLDGIAPGARHR